MLRSDNIYIHMYIFYIWISFVIKYLIFIFRISESPCGNLFIKTWKRRTDLNCWIVQGWLDLSAEKIKRYENLCLRVTQKYTYINCIIFERRFHIQGRTPVLRQCSCSTWSTECWLENLSWKYIATITRLSTQL